MYDVYKSLEDFISDLETVREIEFEYNGKDYSLSYFDKVYISEYNRPETYREYEKIEEFLADYKIDGTPIKELATKIKVTLH
jgi:hypothetical protein